MSKSARPMGVGSARNLAADGRGNEAPGSSENLVQSVSVVHFPASPPPPACLGEGRTRGRTRPSSITPELAGPELRGGWGRASQRGAVLGLLTSHVAKWREARGLQSLAHWRLVK